MESVVASANANAGPRAEGIATPPASSHTAATKSPGIDVSTPTAVRAASPPSAVQTPASSAAIDPLSQHIFMRTNTDQSIPQRLRNPPRPESPSWDAPRQSTDISTKLAAHGIDALKEKRKGPSFLSRLTIRNKRKDAGDMDSDSEFGGSDLRTDGSTAPVFSQGIYDAGGYIPHHKEPPRYIRTKTHYKKTRHFNRMFLAQELGTGNAQGTQIKDAPAESAPGAGDKPDLKGSGAIWATGFSQDGRYFAAAGRDRVIRIWAVISTPEERASHEDEEATTSVGTAERLSAPVFRKRPVMELEGHEGEVLDLSWSKNNFLLSSSMDKTVRLWHMSRKECLCTFKHKDFVTKLAFHPADDRFFLAGSLDTHLRLWSIPDKSVAFTAQLPAMITAVAFTPDGKTAIAGLVNGLCLFYDTDGLKYQTQIHVRSSRGKNAKGSKITGIQAMALPSELSQRPTGLSASPRSEAFSTAETATGDASTGEVKVLISSNDSRIRVYNLRDKALEVKFKGHENASSQLAAFFSDDGRYVTCGSENWKAFIWSMNTADCLGDNKDKRACEYFDAHSAMVTTAKFAPAKMRQLLSESGDPIYDLCNPPPIKLLSLEEAATGISASASQVALGSEAEPAPSIPSIADAVKRASTMTKKSDRYLARSNHPDGNIMVTTDENGSIKVFRQDCAYLKRKHDSWEAGSTLSRTLGAARGFGVGRTSSIRSKTTVSSAPHSRRGSLSFAHPPIAASIGSPQLGPMGAAITSERILSWRQDIEPGGDKRASSILSPGTPTRSERSVSPSKASRPAASSAAHLATEARRQPYVKYQAVKPDVSVTASNPPEAPDIDPPQQPKEKQTETEQPTENNEPNVPEAPPVPSFTFKPADDEEDLRLDPAGASYSFWNLNRWKGLAGGLRGSISGPAGGGHARSSSEAHAPAARRSISGLDRGDDEKHEPSSRDDKARKGSLSAAAARDTNGASAMLSPATTHGGDRRMSKDDERERRNSRADSGPYLSSRGNSVVSKLSMELSGSERPSEGDAAGEDAPRCRKCGGMEFRVKKISSLVSFGPSKHAECCARCGQVWEG